MNLQTGFAKSSAHLQKTVIQPAFVTVSERLTTAELGSEVDVIFF